MKSAISLLSWLAASVFVSELFGYALHRLLHSGRIGFLSRSHMRHHLLLYGPLQPQRPGEEYLNATTGDVALGNIGLEWLVPGALLLGGCVALLRWLKVAPLDQFAFIAGSLAWSFLMFSYLHDRMHVAGFWMERHAFLKRWFVSARRAHDIHHWALDDDGFMHKNFGIAFFFFDHLFGTMMNDRPAFNQRGYANALSRFGDLLNEGESTRDQGSAQAVRAAIDNVSSFRT